MDITDVITMVSPVIEGTADNYRDMGADSVVNHYDGYLQALYDIKHLLANEVDIDTYIRSQLQTFRESIEEAMEQERVLDGMEGDFESNTRLTTRMEQKLITPAEPEE